MAPRFEGCEQVEQIGRGGFGTVYRAYQTAFRRKVAIKVLSVGTSDDTTLRRFRREVGAVGSLSGHPHIVVVHDIGTTEQGDPYLVMAHLSGGTLGDRIDNEGPLGWRAVVAWTIKLAGALEAAHQAGVLHLDVKPDNVLFDEFEEPQLVDFGIARLEGVTHSRSGHVKATPLYAAPEVLSGVSPSPSADVYSLAATMYAALRGRPAFLEVTDETLVPMLTRVLTQPPDPLPEAAVPAPLWDVLSRALTKDPAERHGSAAEFGEALQDGQRTTGTPVTTMTIPGGRRGDGADTRAVDPVARVPTPASEDLNLTVGGGAGPPAPGTPRQPPSSPPTRQWPRRLAVALAVGILAVGVGVIAFVLTDRETPTTTTDVIADIDPATIQPADLSSPSAENPAARPTDLEATAGPDGTVEVTWSNDAPAARGVAVQIGPQVVRVLLADQEGTTVEDIDAERRTCILVGAVGQTEVSWAEAPACVAPQPPAAPSDLEVTRGDGGYVELTWIDRSTNEAGFRVFQDGERVARLGEGRQSFVADAVGDGRVCFTVEAFNETDVAATDEACVRPR